MRVHHAAAMLAAKTTVRAGPHKVACNSKTQVTQRCELKRINKIAKGNCMRNCRKKPEWGNCAMQGSDTPSTRCQRASHGATPPLRPAWKPSKMPDTNELDRKRRYG